jgi:hypothetical protein
MYGRMAERLDHHDLLASAIRTADYLREREYRGYDPFDLLLSPLFRLPVLRTNKTLRFLGQQVFRRIPFNVRPLIGIRPGLNPVTLGLCIHGYTDLLRGVPERRADWDREIDFCLSELVRLQSPGYHGACWGYDFDWEGRYARIPATMPTVVATGFITNALFHLHTVTGNPAARDLCVSATRFVTNDLRKTHGEGGFCYSYSPADTQKVFNATMKGARLLAQVYSWTGDERLREEAAATVRFVMLHQRPSGAWAYSTGDARSWADNFHTAYVLDCLDEFMRRARTDEFAHHLQRGLDYYLRSFFEAGEIPRYYDTSTYPVDATSGAQSILTLLRFGRREQAVRVARWLVAHLQDPEGYHYYQVRKHYTIRIPYTRWSSAWMFTALAALLVPDDPQDTHQ